MYDKFHMSFVPHFIRYGIILLMVLSPIIAIIYMIFFDDDTEELDSVTVRSPDKATRPITNNKKKERGEKID